MSKTIFCFGEPLLRLTPGFEDSETTCYIGGAELNVSAALSKWNVSNIQYITCLPETTLSRKITELINKRNIGTDYIHWSGDRIGTYYLLGGTDLTTQVVYDRKYSSFSELLPGVINWKEIFKEGDWLHWTTISLFLSDAMVDVCEEMLIEAKKKNVFISVDLNFREMLWKNKRISPQQINKLIQYCDVIFGNIWSVEKLLGITVPGSIDQHSTSEQIKSVATTCANELFSQFANCSHIAFSFRFTNTFPGRYLAIHHHQGQNCLSNEYKIERIIDKVGSGDSCMAGLIYGLNQNWPAQECINFAASAAVSKLEQSGDWNNYTTEQILETNKTQK